MRNLVILLAVVALAVPAYGDWYTTTWDGLAGDYDFHNDGNWGNSKNGTTGVGIPDRAPPSGPDDPVAGCIWWIHMESCGSAANPVIVSSDVYYWKWRMGGWGSTNNGDVKMTGGNVRSGNLWIGTNYDYTGTYRGLWTQTGGTVSASIEIGTAWGNAGGPTCDGRYIIEGGSIDTTSTMALGGESSNKIGKGLFKIMGTDPDLIQVGKYVQTPRSTLEIVLNGDGEIELINVSGDAILSGILKVDASAYTGPPITINVLTAGGNLVYKEHTDTYNHDYDTGTDEIAYADLVLDADSIFAHYSLGNDGKTLQVTIPEPATLALLTLGGLGVLIRRRK